MAWVQCADHAHTMVPNPKRVKSEEKVPPHVKSQTGIERRFRR